MTRRESGLAVVACVVVLLAACGGSTHCVTGDSHACTCTDGRGGAQTCGADGTYGACVCESADLGLPDQGAGDAGSDAGADAATDGGAGDAAADLGPVPDAACTPGATRPVDLLLVVDNSPSMVEEQASLATGLPTFVRALTSGDVNGDGTAEYAPVTDLHVGVIDVNMGVGGVPSVPTCSAAPDFGDDGILRTAPGVSVAGCMASYPRFLAYDPTAMPAYDAAALAADSACLARTGTMGCGFEQQLDAPLKALLPSTSSITFHAGTHGHGDDAATNGGFLRASSVIVIVDITDEDDCSTPVPDIWDPSSATHVGDLNLRCIHYTSELYPVARFVDGFATLRPGQPDVVFAAITGVPPDLVADPVDWATLFADPRMTNTIDATSGTPRLVPACSTTGRGSAAPGIRMAQVVQAFGAAGVLGSICADDYSSVLVGIVGRVAARSTCAP